MSLTVTVDMPIGASQLSADELLQLWKECAAGGRERVVDLFAKCWAAVSVYDSFSDIGMLAHGSMDEVHAFADAPDFTQAQVVFRAPRHTP